MRLLVETLHSTSVWAPSNFNWLGYVIGDNSCIMFDVAPIMLQLLLGLVVFITIGYGFGFLMLCVIIKGLV